MNYLPPLSPKAVHPADKFLVINGQTNRIVESAWDMGRANNAAEILNKHEQANGRPCVYKVVNKDD